MHNSSSAQAAKPKAGSSQLSEASLKRKRGMFQKDYHDAQLLSEGPNYFMIEGVVDKRTLAPVFIGSKHMMYGFGDDPNPLPETVALVEDIVVEYITDLVHKAQDISSKRGKLLTDDFLYLIRKDMPKLHRCTELLSMNEELKQARKAFEVDEEKVANTD